MSETAVKPAAAPVKAPKKRSTLLVQILAVLALSVLLAIIVTSGIFSVVNYKMTGGIANSPFVGLQFYERAVNYPIFGASVMNSVVLKALQMLGGLLIALPLTMLICLPFKRPGGVLICAALCLVPMLVPTLTTYHLATVVLPGEVLRTAEGAYALVLIITALQMGGFYTFCAGLFSYLKRRGIGKGAVQGLFVALLIHALTMLSPDFSAIYLSSNALNRNVTTTLDYSIFSYGLMNMNFGLSSAYSIIKVVAQSLLALIPVIILCRIARVDKTRVEIPQAKGGGFTYILANVFWIAAVAAGALVVLGYDAFMRNGEEIILALSASLMSEVFLHQVVISGVIALLGGLVAALIGYGFINLYRNGRKTFGLGMLLVSTALSGLVGEYMLARNLGLINTLIMPILRTAFQPGFICMVIALTIAVRQAPERSTGGMFMMLFFAGAAFAWGDLLSSIIYINRTSSAPLSLLYYRTLMGANTLGTEITEAQIMTQNASKSAYMLALTLPCVFLGLLSALSCRRCFKKAK